MDLWILYEIKYDEDRPNAASKMNDEAIKQGIDSRLMFIGYFKVLDNKLYYKDEEVSVLPKICFIRGHEIPLIKYLENNNVLVINSSYSTIMCKDKWETYKLVEGLDIPQPKSYLMESKNYDECYKLFNSSFLVKYRFGSQGRSIYLINNKEEFDSIVKDIDINEYMLQEYIAESSGKDVRTYILGDNVIGACLRKNDNNFLSNVANGGLSYDYELTEAMKEMSLRITKALKGKIISVDYLIGKDSLLFCEANTNAGFVSFNYLGYPMRELMITYIKTLLK